MAAPITPEDLYRFRWIDHVRLSPDGERVAYQVSWADAASRQSRSRVVVRRLLDAEPVEPSGGVLRDHTPEWSPDGTRLAFVSRVGPADQVFVVDLTTGAPAVQVSSVPEGALAPRWSPDGRWIAFAGLVLSDPEAVIDDPRPPEGREQTRRAPVARVVRTLDYKHDGRGYVDGRFYHLFVAPAGGGESRQLTGGAWDISEFSWAPDSSRLVVAGNAEPGADLQRELNLYIVDLGGKLTRLGGGFYLSSPIWSPRGDLIAFIAPNGLDVGLHERLWVVPLDGGHPRCLTAGFDQAVNDSVINDMRSGHGTRVTWSAEGDRIYFSASGPGVTGLQSVDLEGNVREEAGGRRRIYDFDVARGVIAFCASDASTPGDLYMLTQGAEARLTEVNGWLHDRYVAQPEQEYFTAPDGWRLEGWVLKPPDFTAGKVYPAVMEIHGGPHAQYGWSFFHELQILAGMGFVVFYMNPRGSDGYGETFRRAVVRDWAGKDYVDLMSSLDQLIERTGYIDAGRLGVGGGSYGGYMTNWIVGQTDRFRAAVSMRSISNLVSEYAQHDIVLWGTLQLGAPPWPDLDELWRRSPIRYVQNVHTPLLLTAGEMDLRCAMSQSEELFGALRLLGRPVELVRFPEESHDLSRNGRPDRRVERLKRIVGWFERHLGTAAADRPATEEATQMLPTPAAAPREWAKTVAMPATAETAVLSPAEPAAEAAVEAAAQAPVEAAEEPAAPEPEVLQPTVSELATAPAPIVEPEALPDLPSFAGDEGEPAAAGASDAAPEIGVAAAVQAEEARAEPFLEVAAPAEEPPAPEVPSPAAEVQPVAAEAAMPEAEVEPLAEEAAMPEAEVQPLAEDAVPADAELQPPVEATASVEEAAGPPPEPVSAEPESGLEPEPEPGSAIAEPMLATLEEPVSSFDGFAMPSTDHEPAAPEAVAEAMTPAEPASTSDGASLAEAAPADAAPALEAAAAPEPEPVPEPVLGPAVAAAAEAVPAPAPAVQDTNATLVAWPGSGPVPAPAENGSRSDPSSFEEATSVIPAWQQTDPNANSKQTVSLQALPPEEVASGAGYAALLTFETGPFAGRIVALPNQLVTFGRAPDNDVVVGDPATSGHHGRIEPRAGSFWIADLGSTNGTLVNGEPVIEKQLNHGDMIAIGQNTLRFTLEG